MDAVVIAKAPVCVPLGGDMGELAGLYERSGGPVISAATGYCFAHDKVRGLGLEFR